MTKIKLNSFIILWAVLALSWFVIIMTIAREVRKDNQPNFGTTPTAPQVASPVFALPFPRNLENTVNSPVKND